ncbi:hypothetical protein LguiB_024515 [Lonicera macranthoides]
MEDYGSSEDDYCWYEYDSIELEDTEFQNDRAPSSKVITKASLLAAQKEDLQRVMDLLSLKEHHARTLLIHYRWDVDKVLTVFVEKGKDKLYAEAGVIVKEHDGLPSPQFPPSRVMCEICLEEVPGIDTTRMECGHCFCNNCWTEHFIVKINEGQSRRIRCMAYKCNAICEEGKIINLVEARDPNLAEKFNRFLLESYIEDNKRVKWCPSVPHCGNAIRIEDDEYCEVECACGQQFCFSCLCEAHSPCSCQMWELWTKKCKDESESINWITVNTKTCPNCCKPVEKNGGCNMRSKFKPWHLRPPSVNAVPVCSLLVNPDPILVCSPRASTSWKCGGAVNNHGAHGCGRYKEEHEKKTDLAKTELMRYIHYYNHFKAHTDSFKAEVKLKAKMQAKISTLEVRESGSRDFSWVLNGLCRLFRSRRILSYSYPFAYYMFGGELFKEEMTKKGLEIKRNLFEDQQQQLEANVERLSMFLEEPFDGYSDDRVMGTRMKVINLTKLTDDLCKKLYECIGNDLLGPLQNQIHIIAPYRSKGAEKAEEFPGNDSTDNNALPGPPSKRFKKPEASSRG